MDIPEGAVCQETTLLSYNNQSLKSLFLNIADWMLRDKGFVQPKYILEFLEYSSPAIKCIHDKKRKQKMARQDTAVVPGKFSIGSSHMDENPYFELLKWPSPVLTCKEETIQFFFSLSLWECIRMLLFSRHDTPNPPLA